MRAVRIVAALALSAMAACSTAYSATDEPSVEAGTDAGLGDGAAPGDSGGAGLDAGADAVDLLANGDFELGCAAWGGDNAVLTPNTDPALVHGGTGSCLVCTTGDAGVQNELFASAVVAAPPGARFYGGAWLRSAPTTAPPALTAHLDVADTTGAGLEQGLVTPAAPLVAEWHKATALVDVTASDGGRVNVYFVGMESGRCYLVDDAWLYRIK